MLQKFLANKKLFYGSIAGVLVIIVGSVFAFGNGNGGEIISVEKKDLKEVVRVSGTVEAESVAALGFQVGGTVSKVSVKTNQPVSAGQELLRLNLGTLPAELKSAEADLAIKKAEGSNDAINLSAIKDKQDALVKSAKATLYSEGLESEPENSTYTQTPPTISGRYFGDAGTYKVIIRLGTQGNDALLSVFDIETIRDIEISKTSATPLGSKGLYISFPDNISNYYDTIWYVEIPNTKSDSYLTNYNSYQETLEERNRAIEEAEQKMRNQSAGSSIVQAELTRAQAAVDKIYAEIEKHIIRAPFAGIVAALDIDPGEAVSAGNSVVTVISDSKLGVEIDLPEIDSIKVNSGDKAEITLDALGDKIFTGTVESVNRTETIVDGVAVYEARIVLDEPGENIISGMTAEVTITTDEVKEAIAIPLRALRQKNDDTFYVMKINQAKEAEEARVSVGIRSSDGFAEILNGLSENDQVVAEN